MVVHLFPNSLQALQHCAQDGAVDFSGWIAFIQEFGRHFPGGNAEIVYRASDLRVPTLCLNAAGFHVALVDETTPCISAFPAGQCFVQHRMDWAHRPVEGAGLVLHRSAAGSWVLRAWLPEKAQSRLRREGLLRMLAAFAATNVRSFSLALQLAHGQCPPREEVEDAWDHVPFPALLVTPRLEILAANAAAEDMRHDRSLFWSEPRRNRLTPGSRLLREEIDEALHLVGDGLVRSCSIRLPRGGASAPELAMQISDPRFVRMPPFYPIQASGKAEALVIRIGRRDEVVRRPPMPGGAAVVLPFQLGA